MVKKNNNPNKQPETVFLKKNTRKNKGENGGHVGPAVDGWPVDPIGPGALAVFFFFFFF